MKISELGYKTVLGVSHIPDPVQFGAEMQKLEKHISDAKHSGNPTAIGLAEVIEFLFTAGGWDMYPKKDAKGDKK